jgi:hypothetical protein
VNFFLTRHIILPDRVLQQFMPAVPMAYPVVVDPAAVDSSDTRPARSPTSMVASICFFFLSQFAASFSIP